MTQYWPFSGLIRQSTLRERLIVSLDLGERRDALKLVDRLARVVGMFKVGRALFVGGGPDFVREIRRRGAEVFLDLKFHDSSQKMLRAAVEATRLGVKMFDIHAYGSPAGATEVMNRTRAEVSRICRTEGLRRPHVLAVAMLAEMKPAAPRRETQGCSDRVAEIARIAADAALDGVFTSPREVTRVRNLCGRRFIIVTSGVVSAGATTPGARSPANGGLAQHPVSAADAIRAGADYVVVGGPVWRSAEPVRVVREIADDIERGLRTNSRIASEVQNPRPV
ncbi:MAG TPA: orotidine-5'-phosphate decarboxylase [Candidatus Acidoferrales bacterium]|nr:orotidine-5'-phosphate decarboxylase [Candidatus Acidoferrales bacterium]